MTASETLTVYTEIRKTSTHVSKLANYGLDHWLALPRYIPEDEVRLMLKTTYRQYQQFAKVQTMLKNNLISLLDTAFPDANRLFTSPARADGSEKWVDFVAAFPHCEASGTPIYRSRERWRNTSRLSSMSSLEEPPL